MYNNKSSLIVTESDVLDESTKQKVNEILQNLRNSSCRESKTWGLQKEKGKTDKKVKETV